MNEIINIYDEEKVGKRLGNLESLPEELKKQLQIFNINDISKKILEVFKQYDGYANIDEIMVGLYRKYNIIIKRTELINRLYRLAKRGSLEKVKRKTGIYLLKK